MKLIKSEVGEQENKSLVCSSANNLLIYLLTKTVNATYLKSDSVVEIVSIFCYFRHSFFLLKRKYGNYNTLKSILPNKVEAASTAPL